MMGVRTYWIRDYPRASSGLWFAYCWLHKKASMRFLNESKALAELPCHCTPKEKE